MNRLFSSMLVTLLVFLCGNGTLAHAAGINWALQRPFKLIRDPQMAAQLSATYEELVRQRGGVAVSPRELERSLQDSDPSVAQSGWFSKLSLDNHWKTCWDSFRLRYRVSKPEDNQTISDERYVEGCDDYIHPRSHVVSAQLDRLSHSPATVEHGVCVWFLEGREIDRAWCRESVTATIPYPAGARLSVALSSSPGVTIADEYIEVEDLLVVGLGDSYASGEGNPDTPVTFNQKLRDGDLKIFSSTGRKTPKSDPLDRARWTDRRCHRSMYSYQFKAALQMALENPKQAITFVSYSCSGAIIDEMVKKRQEGWGLVEHARSDIAALKPDKSYRSAEPQLDALVKDLCISGRKKDCVRSEQRAIDVLMLSIGGNDIGFAGYVADIVFPSRTWLRVPLSIPPFNKIRKPKARDVESISGLSKGYAELNEALIGRLNIRNCPAPGSCSRILLNGYPDPLNNESGSPCDGERGEFKVPFGKDGKSKRMNRILKTKRLIFEPLLQAQKLAASVNGWTYVTSHFDAFARHGFCAQDPDRRTDVNELVTIPEYVNGSFRYRSGNSREWIEFPIAGYRKYASRQRWFRIPIDSKLGIGQGWNHYGIGRDLFFSDETAGIMHPTAEGTAAMAAANLFEIGRILKY